MSLNKNIKNNCYELMMKKLPPCKNLEEFNMKLKKFYKKKKQQKPKCWKNQITSLKIKRYEKVVTLVSKPKFD